MSPLVNRRLALLLVAPAAALVLSSCSATPVALRVGDQEYSKDFVERDLAAMAQAQIAARPSEEEKSTISFQIYGGTDKHRYSADYTQFVLNNRMAETIVHLEFEASGLKRKRLAAAKLDKMFQQFGGETAFRKMPEDLQALAMRASEEMTVLADSELVKLGTVEAFFEANRSRFPSKACTSHILVSTREAAVAVQQRLAAGEDFAKVAKEVSLDPGSKDDGGSLGCGDPAQFVPEFAEVARTQPIGKVSDPVQTQYGFHLIVVTSRTEATLDTARVSVQQAMDQAAQAAVERRLITRLQKTPVSVDPALGTILREGPNGYTQIMPPGYKPVAAAVAAASR